MSTFCDEKFDIQSMIVLEDHLERAALDWLADLGYQRVSGYDIAPDGITPERADFRQVILVERLRSRLTALNISIPSNAIEAAIQQLLTPNLPSLIQSNRQFHRWLRDGVRVEFQRDGETVADFVR